MTRAAQSPTNRAELIEAAHMLADTFRNEASVSELERQPSERAVEALSESGVLRLFLPMAHGGLELDLDDFLEVGLILADADASLAWVANFLIEHVWWFTQFPESFQKEVFASGPPTAAGVIAPTARVAVVPGGYRVTGRWSWASGSSCSDWMLAGGLQEGAEGVAAITLLAIPMSELVREDTWHVDGMCGTASGDVVAQDVFVPEERGIPFHSLLAADGPGAVNYDGAIYRTPALPILMMAVATTAIGQARSAVTRYASEVVDKVRGMGPPEREKPSAQMRLARSTMKLRKAELLLRDIVTDVTALRNTADSEARARWMAAYAEVSHSARRVALDISKAAGASAHFRDHPLQRTVRDLNTLCAHAGLNEDAITENLGRVMLGLEPNSPLG